MNGLWDKTVSKLNGVRRSLQGPGLFDVMASAINIMQHNITKSRMAGDPPDVTLRPRLAHIGLLEFDRAAECIQQGRDCVTRQLAYIERTIER
jgi:NTE family protein